MVERAGRGIASPAKKATSLGKAAGDSASRGSSRSPADGKLSEEAISLSARLGSLMLTEKESEGFVFSVPGADLPKAMKWSAVGRVFSPRPLNIKVFERVMHKAWGLHREAQLMNIGRNIFAVHFGSEGDWRHALFNGPWQFDFNVVVIKDYDGSTRPSEMVFDKIDTWV